MLNYSAMSVIHRRPILFDKPSGSSGNRYIKESSWL